MLIEVPWFLVEQFYAVFEDLLLLLEVLYLLHVLLEVAGTAATLQLIHLPTIDSDRRPFGLLLRDTAKLEGEGFESRP